MMHRSTNWAGRYPPELLELFDVLVNVIFCVKDLDHRYLEVNRAFIRRTGRKSKRDVVGGVASDFFPGALAERYEDQDRTVFTTGKAVRDELEPIRRPNGEFGWYLTTKLPVVDTSGSIRGLVSVSRDLETPSAEGIAVASLSHVVDYVHANLGRQIKVADLARVASCSPSQLERRMRKVFGLTATQYVMRVRVDEAMRRLRSAREPLADVALTCGFYDQSSFTRIFARLTGETPAQFRAAHPG